MARVLVRYRSPNKDTVFIQKRILNVFTLVPYVASRLCIALFTKRSNTIPDWCWDDWTDMRNIVRLIDEDLNYHTSEIERLKGARDAAEKRIQIEVESLKDDFNENRGYSRPFYINTEEIQPIGLKFRDPGQDWKKLLNPKFLGTERKTASGKPMGGGNTISGGFNTTYTLDDFAAHRVALGEVAKESGSEGIVMYTQPQKGQNAGKGGGGSGNFNPNNRKKQQGESPEGHQARMQAIQSGDDVSNWQPY